MAQQLINIGTLANDGTGDALRTGGGKINANFTELYSKIGYVGTKEVNEADIADGYVLQYDLASNKLIYVTKPQGLWQQTGGTTQLVTPDNVIIKGDTTGGAGNILELKDSANATKFSVRDDSKISTPLISIGNGAGIGTNTSTIIGINASSTNTPLASICIGYNAGVSAVGSSVNGAILIGNSTGAYRPFNLLAIGHDIAINGTEGSNNTIVGNKSAKHLLGSNNTILGHQAAGSRTSSSFSNNVMIGYNSNFSLTTTSISGSIFIGTNSGYYETNSNRFIITNKQATTQATHQAAALLYGVMDAVTANQLLYIHGKVGINTDSPSEYLDVNGNINATAYKVGTVAGVSGTFTTADAKTVTVTNGIITSIV